MVIQGELSWLVTIAAGGMSLAATVAWTIVAITEGRHARWRWVNLSLIVFCGWFTLIYGLVLLRQISGQEAGIYLRPATAGMMFVLACLTLRFQPGGWWSWKPRQ